MNSEIEKYILDHSDPEGDYLYRLYRATNIHLLHGRMASGHLQGRVLKMLVRMIRPKNILEIGTFSGYSAICLAEGLEEGGMVYTFEINDEQEDFTRPWIEQSAVADKIRFIIGDAMTEAPKLGVEFDMAFVDGDKRTYMESYEMVLSLLRPGGFILADITFGTNNEFGFDYLRDNMANSPDDLVQRAHNYAIVDEVDSVLIDDARTPLIISGPVPKGDDQMFEEYQPLVEKLVEVQRKLATQFLAEAKQKITEGKAKNDSKLLEEGFLSLYRSHKSLPSIPST